MCWFQAQIVNEVKATSHPIMIAPKMTTSNWFFASADFFFILFSLLLFMISYTLFMSDGEDLAPKIVTIKITAL